MIDQYDIQIDDLPPDYRQIAEAIGLEAALALAEIRDGQGVYVPKRDHEEIREVFKKFKIKPVSLKYTVSKGKQTTGREFLILYY